MQTAVWADGRIAEVYKEDKLYPVLNEITTPGVEYVSALIIKANEVFSFYGDGIQIADANGEYERLKQEQAEYTSEKNRKKLGGIEKIALPTLPKFHLPGKTTAQKAAGTTESEDDD